MTKDCKILHSTSVFCATVSLSNYKFKNEKKMQDFYTKKQRLFSQDQNQSQNFGSQGQGQLLRFSPSRTLKDKDNL